MKKITMLAAALAAPALLAQTTVNLQSQFNADVFLETGGTGQGEALDAEGRRIDASTLPESYTDGSLVTSTNGRSVFRFGNLLTDSLDAIKIDGQTIDVQDGRYSSIDLALLAAPGSFGNPFPQLEFIYADGVSSNRLGPIAGWMNRPSAFANALYRYSDESAVTEYVSFATNGENDVDQLVASAGSALSGGWRFADASGYLLYRLDAADITSGKLGITIGNNFVVSVASEFLDPSVSTTEGYTVLAKSSEIYNGVDHHALGNLKAYEYDVSEYLAAGTGELYVLLTDGSPADGWGPFVQRIRLFEGTPLNFEERIETAVDASDATVYANFQIASDEESPFLYDNNGSGPSSRGHRFADGNGSLTYRFDLPNDVTSAKMVVDMENNFVVSVSGPSEGTVFAKVQANSPEEATYLVDAGNSATQPNARFADAAAYMIYEFDLPDNATTAFARVQVGNQFVVEAANGSEGEYVVLQDYYQETGIEVRDNSNLDFYVFNLSEYLTDNATKTVRLRLRDGIPSDGWGPYLRTIEIVDSETAGAFTFTEVLNSQEMFGEDVHNEINRNLYTIDLTSALTANNPNREVYIRFTDGSTFDGWGPSLYWMAVYSGELEILSDSHIFPGLKTTLGDPETMAVGLLSRNYPLDPARTLTSIKLPDLADTESSQVYLLAATLNEATTVAAPELDIATLANNRVRISWAAADGFQLQSTSSLTAPAQWANVTTTPQNNGGTMSVEVDAAAGQQFFRLVK